MIIKLFATILIAFIIFAYVLYIVIKTTKQIKNNENPCASCPSSSTCHSRSCVKTEEEKAVDITKEPRV